MAREYVEWQGPGWYAPVQTGAHENQAIGWFAVAGDFRRDGYSEDAESAVWNATKPQGLGTPRWLDSTEEL